MRLKSSMIMQNSIFLWVALAAGAVLLVPLVVMQFTDEVEWQLIDFIIMGSLLFGAGSLLVLAARRWRMTRSRMVAAIILAAVLFYAWAELAVGVLIGMGS